MTNKAGWWKPIFIALVLVLYPMCFLGGCAFGMYKMMNLAGAVIIADGLLARYFVEVGSNVHLTLVSTANETPDSVVVDFRNLETGSLIKSETVSAERSTDGSPYFEFNFPKEITDSSSQHVTATIRSR